MPAHPALIDYLKTRRSVGIGFLKDPGPTPAELEEILSIGTRVPDHGKLVPFRFLAIEGDARRALGEALAARALERDPHAPAAEGPDELSRVVDTVPSRRSRGAGSSRSMRRCGRRRRGRGIRAGRCSRSDSPTSPSPRRIRGPIA